MNGLLLDPKHNKVLCSYANVDHSERSRGCDPNLAHLSEEDLAELGYMQELRLRSRKK